jgi:hypothetical protein
MVTLRDRLRDEMAAATRSGQALRRDTPRVARTALCAVEKRARGAHLGGGGRG